MTADARTIDPARVKARLAELHLRDYLEFVVWPILEPATPFVGGWPIDAMCEHLEAVTKAPITRLVSAQGRSGGQGPIKHFGLIFSRGASEVCFPP